MTNKVAVVTGAANGIGKATALSLSQDGFDVAIIDLDMAAAHQVVSTVERAGRRAMALQADVAEEAAVKAAMDHIAEQFSAIDVLVNNAAAFIMEDIQASVQDWRRVLDVNVMGPALCVKHALVHMKQRPGAAVVNLASISAHIAQANFVTYNTSKAAILGLTRCLALDLAKYGIRVNAVSPGSVWTASLAQLCASRGLNRAQAERTTEFGAAHILKRCADPDEIAAAISFLCSSKASFITGEILRVDGGYTAI